MDAVILAGGLGTRLRSVVSDRPKPLAPIAGVPFLLLKLAQLEALGVDRVVLSIGYMGERIVQDIGHSFGSLAIHYVHEPTALGTGGATRLALASTQGREVLLSNGDSYCTWSMACLSDKLSHPPIELAMTLARVPDAARYGTVTLDASDTVTGFHGKGQTGPALINAGVYLMHRDLLDAWPLGQAFSLENDVFPDLARTGRIAGCPTADEFIDIGVPEDLARAQTALKPAADQAALRQGPRSHHAGSSGS